MIARIRKTILDIHPVFLVALVALCYYVTLAAKDWSWMFVSGDSGDWMAASKEWIVPQPYGSPLYILLGHLVSWLNPTDSLYWSMTFFLSVIPATITVCVVYLIVKELGYSTKLAFLASGALLSCAIFLSQATVLEEYSLASMFVTLSFYFYVKQSYKLMFLMLGFGLAIHIIIGAIAFAWLAVSWTEYKDKLKHVLPIFLTVGILPYSMILILMASDTPRLIAGGLSLGSINNYLGSSGTIGQISIIEAPNRLWEASHIFLTSFGLCIIPIIFSLKKPWDRITRITGVSLALCLWLYLTNVDPTTWTFLTFVIPIIIVSVIIGLTKLPQWSIKAVTVSVLVLLFLNAGFLNADTLSKDNPKALAYYQSVNRLPLNSAVVTSHGGPYGLGLMYIMTERTDLAPIFLQKEDSWNAKGYRDYILWVTDSKGLKGDNWNEQIINCLTNNTPVFITYSIQPPEWKERLANKFQMKDYNEHFKQVISAIQISTPTVAR